jgi:hypothetical protein
LFLAFRFLAIGMRMTEEIQKAMTAGKSKIKRRAKRTRGRPSIYSTELATEICYRIASGKSLRAVCGARNIPNRSTVLRWLSSHPDFAEQYGRAMEQRAYILLDEVLDIADDSSRDYKKIRGGKPVLDFEHIQRARLRVAARQWFFSGLRARKYGDGGRKETSRDGGGSGEVTIRWAHWEAEATPDPAETLPPSLK